MIMHRNGFVLSNEVSLSRAKKSFVPWHVGQVTCLFLTCSCWRQC